MVDGNFFCFFDIKNQIKACNQLYSIECSTCCSMVISKYFNISPPIKSLFNCGKLLEEFNVARPFTFQKVQACRYFLLSQKFDLKCHDLTYHYLSLYQGTSRARCCHLGSLSIVSSILHKLSQNSHNTSTPITPLAI